MVRVVHLSNDYSGSTVYMNLIRELDRVDVEQIVYSPVRDVELVGRNSVDLRNKDSEIIYSKILNKHIDRVFYPYKIFKIIKDIENKIDFTDVDFIHAHTWYSDGGVAYFLSKKYGIPYSVAIRSTDLNIFQKKLVYLRPFGCRVLRRANNIFLVSASYLPQLLLQKSLKSSLLMIKNKIKVLPNGVDPYWINNAVEHGVSENSAKKINLIYVGQLIERKNVPLVQEAVLQINRMNGYNVHLSIVGGGGAESEKVVAMSKAYPEFFTYHGQVFEKAKLAALYRSSNIFVMPSSHETFGLVYVEAMLQGLPVLYTANEGIDGFYSDEIGEKVQEPSVHEIVEKITAMAEKINSYQLPTAELKRNHDWTEIAKCYLSVYKASL